ncbi:unnamed protein product, partial [Heterotrigona itama]
TSKDPRHTGRKRCAGETQVVLSALSSQSVTLQAFGDAQRGRIADWTSDYKRDAARRDATQSPSYQLPVSPFPTEGNMSLNGPVYRLVRLLLLVGVFNAVSAVIKGNTDNQHYQQQ